MCKSLNYLYNRWQADAMLEPEGDGKIKPLPKGVYEEQVSAQSCNSYFQTSAEEPRLRQKAQKLMGSVPPGFSFKDSLEQLGWVGDRCCAPRPALSKRQSLWGSTRCRCDDPSCCFLHSVEVFRFVKKTEKLLLPVDALWIVWNSQSIHIRAKRVCKSQTYQRLIPSYSSGSSG
jgi:hypothetical protein